MKKRKPKTSRGPLYRTESSPYWQCAFSVAGRQYRLSTKKTKREDEEIERAKLIVKCGGEAPKKRTYGLLRNPPFFAVVEAYDRERTTAGCNPSSYDRLRGPWVEKLGKRLVRSITTELVAETIDDLVRERGWSPATHATTIAELSGLFSFALRRGWIEAHPIRGGMVAKPRVDNARERWLRPEEIEAIRRAAPRWLRDVIDFAVRTTRRRGEITSLTPKNISFDVNGTRSSASASRRSRRASEAEARGGARRERATLPGTEGW